MVSELVIVSTRPQAEGVIRRHEWSLVVDLGSRIGSVSWFRGLATCGALCWAAISLAPANQDSGPFEHSPGPADEAAVKQAEHLAFSRPAVGAPTGLAFKPSISEGEVGRALNTLPSKLSVVVSDTGGLRPALRLGGLSEKEAAAVSMQIQSLVPKQDRPTGATIHLQLGKRPSADKDRPLERLSYRGALGREVALRKDAGVWALTSTGMAVETTPLKITGKAGRGLDDGEAGWSDDRGSPATGTALARPVPGFVTSGFGYRRHPILGYWRMHNGLDIRAAYGTPILAAADGLVSRAGWAGGRGKEVRLHHAGGLSTSYSHMSVIGVMDGEFVRRNDVIGYVGSTGLSTGPHVHFEVRKHGRPLDPALAGLRTR